MRYVPAGGYRIMAEGVLGGLIGSDEAEHEKAGARLAMPGDRADPLARSIAVAQVATDPDVSRHTAAFMATQARIGQAHARIAEREDAQSAEELRVRLHHLHDETRESRLRRAGLWMRLGTQLFFALIATLIIVGIATMLRDAVTSRSVVVEAFKAPAALAPQGLTGDVVAAAVLDKLIVLHDHTRAVSRDRETRGAWASDIKIDVPETGVSLGEISRLLYQRFGNDLHVGGDLVQTASGPALTIRGDGIPAKTFTGPAGDLDKLATAAAEHVYGASQPISYASYLKNVKRYADVLAFAPSAFAGARTDYDRAVIADIWGDTYWNIGQTVPASAKYRVAVSLSPRGSAEWWLSSGALLQLTAAHDEEAAWRGATALLKAYAAATPDARPQLQVIYPVASIVDDEPLMLRVALDEAKANPGMDQGDGSVQIADIYATMHAPTKAAQWIAASNPAAPLTKFEALVQQIYPALDRGDGVTAIPPLEALNKLWLANAEIHNNFTAMPCYFGLAYGLVGRTAESEVAFGHAPPGQSQCFAFHGTALSHQGDVAGARRVWAAGLKIGPDLPPVYLARGQFELDHGDLSAAAADFATAHAKAPHFADPLKGWGDVLAKQGRWPDAAAKYAETINYAPDWAELHTAQAAAARH